MEKRKIFAREALNIQTEEANVKLSFISVQQVVDAEVKCGYDEVVPDTVEDEPLETDMMTGYLGGLIPVKMQPNSRGEFEYVLNHKPQKSIYDTNVVEFVSRIAKKIALVIRRQYVYRASMNPSVIFTHPPTAYVIQKASSLDNPYADSIEKIRCSNHAAFLNYISFGRTCSLDDFDFILVKGEESDYFISFIEKIYIKSLI